MIRFLRQTFLRHLSKQASPSVASEASTTPEVELEKPEPLVVGQPMKNINYFTNKKDPIVMADEEYPSWIFDVIGDKPKRTEILKDSEIQSAKELKRNNKLKIREWQLENTKKK